MAELKTQPTDGDVEAFVDSIADEAMRADCRALLDLMREATGERPVLWGTSIVGFGDVHYRYASGREGDWFAVGFAPRKRSLTVYVMDGVDAHADQLSRLGRHTVGKGCIYLRRLSDVDTGVLREIVASAAAGSDSSAS